jgi:hypothetical protein
MKARTVVSMTSTRQDDTERTLAFSELVNAVNEALSGRQGAVDGRTLRFWRTEGLLSPPLGSGRGARWMWRHVLEATSVRVRQDSGAHLADLAGTTTETDEDLAKITGLTAAPAPGWLPPAETGRAFWDTSTGEAAPASRATPTTDVRSAEDTGFDTSSPRPRRLARSATPAPQHANLTRTLIELGDGVAVVLPTSFATNNQALASLTPTLDELHRLITTHTETSP